MKDMMPQIAALLDAGYEVYFSKDPSGYVASVSGPGGYEHDAIAAGPAAALEAALPGTRLTEHREDLIRAHYGDSTDMVQVQADLDAGLYELDWEGLEVSHPGVTETPPGDGDVTPGCDSRHAALEAEMADLRDRVGRLAADTLSAESVKEMLALFWRDGCEHGKAHNDAESVS